LPFRISFFLSVVRLTIEFDHQAHVGADKIHYEVTEWLLATKLETAELAIAQAVPNCRLGVIGSLPHFACTLEKESFVVWAMTHGWNSVKT